MEAIPNFRPVVIRMPGDVEYRQKKTAINLHRTNKWTDKQSTISQMEHCQHEWTCEMYSELPSWEKLSENFFIDNLNYNW